MRLYNVTFRTEDEDGYDIWFKRREDAKRYFDIVVKKDDDGDIRTELGVMMTAIDFPMDEDGVLELLNGGIDIQDADTGQGAEAPRVRASMLYQSDIRVY
jgi:hypothetical protein